MTIATTTTLYLGQTGVIGLNTNTLQDLLDVLGLRALIASQGSEQVSSNVTHPERTANQEQDMFKYILSIFLTKKAVCI